MKTYKAIVVALLLGACPAAWADFSQGTNYLANTNLMGAYTNLAGAVKASPAAGRRTTTLLIAWQ